MKIFRLLLKLSIVLLVILVIGGFFMRRTVVKKLEQNLVTSSSVLLTRPFPVSAGVSFNGSRIPNRLRRLGYQQLPSSPPQPGYFSLTSKEALIYLRKTKFPRPSSGARKKDGELRQQGELLVRLTLDEQDRITSVADARTGKQLQQVWLEPEHLSLLGNNSTRASTPKPLSAFPPFLIKAILATEDERFYLHYGIDPLGIARALFVNIQSGRTVQGGSTITQQLAKNLFFSNERSLVRKLFEAVSAVFIETAFTKDQILEFYLNEVFLGQEGSVALHGFAEASLSFFGRDVERIHLDEAATLAAIVKAPTGLSPRRYPERAKERRDIILDKMKELGYISDAEHREAASQPVTAQPPTRSRRVAPYFVDYVHGQLKEVVEKTDPNNRNLKIFTGLDREYQECAEDAIESGLLRVEKSRKQLRRKGKPLQAALISTLPSTGEIVAWVGGRNYGQNQFCRVSLAKRQPGSSFKPFVYLTALDSDLNRYRVARTTSILVDEPTTIQIAGIGDWTPENYDREYRGEVTVREALVHSLNIPTVSLASKVGIQSVKKTAELFGLGEDLPAVYSLALGSVEVTPLQLTQAYAALANGGVLKALRPILSVELDNQIIPSPQHAADMRVASDGAVYVLGDILRSAVNNGTGRAIRNMGFKGAVAGKTGTSNDSRDAWFAGYTPRVLTVVWVGFDDNAPTGLTGGEAAAPIFADYMKCLGAMEPEVDFLVPSSVVSRQVDLSTGQLATPNCPRERITSEVFVSRTEPVTECTAHSSSFVSQEEEPVPSGEPG